MQQRAGVGIAILLCLALVGLRIAWFPPAPDEALVAVPAWNLAHYGFAGTTTLADPASPWKDIARRTYNTLPGGILWMAAVYSVFPGSLAVTRIATALWGCVLAGAFFVFLRRLTEDRSVAALATVLLCLDYHFVIASAYARVDMMTAALGVAALACYGELRERYFNRAVLAASALVVCACLTHPQGVLYAIALVAVAVARDRCRISWAQAGLAALPVVAFGGMWLWYIAQDPAAALSQLRTNGSGQGRLPVRFSIWKALRREVLVRYVQTVRISLSAAWVVKAALLAVPFVGAVGMGATPRLRRRPGVGLLALLTVLLFLVEAFLENSKTHFYLIHMDVFYAAVVSACVCFAYRRGGWSRWAGVAVVAGVLAMNLSGVAARLKEDHGGTGYRPAAAFLRSAVRPGDAVIGPSEFWFEFHSMKDDPTWGAGGQAPDYIVDLFRKPAPAGFECIYNYSGYRIYRRSNP
jgi:hypothetical protein